MNNTFIIQMYLNILSISNLSMTILPAKNTKGILKDDFQYPSVFYLF
jgi:hypothetical protein